MAATVVVVKLSTAQTGLVLKLYQKGDDTLLNGTGDALSEDATRKCYYTATVDESITGDFDAVIEDADGVGIAIFDLIGLLDTVGPFECEEHSTSATATALAAAKAVIDNIKTTVDATSAIATKLNGMLELDGLVYRFTANALELAPTDTGGGGGGDCDTKEEIAEEVWANVPAQGVYITVVGPLLPSGDISLVAGDDYLTIDGTSIPFTIVGQPSLVGATVLFTTYCFDTGARVVVLEDIECEVVDATHILLPLESDETSLLVPGSNYRFDIQATLASGSHKTLTNGKLFTQESYTEPSTDVS